METSTGKTKRLYERPRMTAVELQQHGMMMTSDLQNRNAIMNVTYEEEDI